ncbi:BolA-like protein 3 [Pseudocercospora fuligena]|uniref:BolA-like protein 3 n=1 Tax=Pseudocercospora fuligena TaxID=685502 RepID=A0A8H6RAV6_9PEZI|nr:BolA-like protein 3 [Pseudocercospora fuligena]
MASRTFLQNLSRTPSRFASRQFIPSRSPFLPITSRFYSSPVEAPDYLDANERRVFDLVKAGLEPSKLEVQDISGGCGSMYALDIVSEKFKGLPVIKQHRLVNQILGEEIKKWHGVQLKTKAP